MDTWDAMGFEVSRLSKKMVAAYGLDILIIGSVYLIDELCRYFRREDTGQDRELRLAADRLKARDNRDINALGSQGIAETVEILVIIEKLSYHIFSPKVNFFLKPIYVTAHIGSLRMFLRITSHSESKSDLWLVNSLTINRYAIIEVINLGNELRGMLMRQLTWDDSLLVIIATEQEKVMNAKEIKVDEAVLSLFGGKALANDMRDSWDAKAMLNGGSHSHCAWPFADKRLSQRVTLGGRVYRLGMMDRYIDKEGIEFTHLLNVSHQFRRSFTLDWR